MSSSNEKKITAKCFCSQDLHLSSVLGFHLEFFAAYKNLPDCLFPSVFPYQKLPVPYFAKTTHPFVPAPGLLCFGGAYLEFVFVQCLKEMKIPAKDLPAVENFLAVIQDSVFMTRVFFVAKDVKYCVATIEEWNSGYRPKKHLLDFYDCILLNQKTRPFMFSRMSHFYAQIPAFTKLLKHVNYPSFFFEHGSPSRFLLSGVNCLSLYYVFPLTKHQVLVKEGHVLDRRAMMPLFPLPMIFEGQVRVTTLEDRLSFKNHRHQFKWANDYLSISHLSFGASENFRSYPPFLTLFLPTTLEKMIPEISRKEVITACQDWTFPVPSFWMEDARQLHQVILSTTNGHEFWEHGLVSKFLLLLVNLIPMGIIFVPLDQNSFSLAPEEMKIHAFLWFCYCRIFLNCQSFTEPPQGIMMRILLVNNGFLPLPLALLFFLLFQPNNNIFSQDNPFLFRPRSSHFSSTFLLSNPSSTTSCTKSITSFFCEVRKKHEEEPDALQVISDNKEIPKEEEKSYRRSRIYIHQLTQELKLNTETTKQILQRIYDRPVSFLLIQKMVKNQKSQFEKNKMGQNVILFPRGRVELRSAEVAFFDGQTWNRETQWSYSPFYEAFMNTSYAPIAITVHFDVAAESLAYVSLKHSFLMMEILNIRAQVQGLKSKSERQTILILDASLLVESTFRDNLQHLGLTVCSLFSWDVSVVRYTHDTIQESDILILHPDLFAASNLAKLDRRNNEYYQWIVQSRKSNLIVTTEMFQQEYKLIPFPADHLIVVGNVREWLNRTQLQGLHLFREFLSLPPQVTSGGTRLTVPDEKLLNLIFSTLGMAVVFDEHQTVYLQEWAQKLHLKMNSTVHPQMVSVSTAKRAFSELQQIKATWVPISESVFLCPLSPSQQAEFDHLVKVMTNPCAFMENFNSTWMTAALKLSEQKRFTENDKITEMLHLFTFLHGRQVGPTKEKKKKEATPLNIHHMPGLNYDNFIQELTSSLRLISRAASLGVFPTHQTESAHRPSTPIFESKKKMVGAQFRCLMCERVTYDYMWRLFDCGLFHLDQEKSRYRPKAKDIPLMVDMIHYGSLLQGMNCRFCWLCLRRLRATDISLTIKAEQSDPTCRFLLQDEPTPSEHSTWDQRSSACPSVHCARYLNPGQYPYSPLGTIKRDTKLNIQIMSVTNTRKELLTERHEVQSICLVCGVDLLLCNVTILQLKCSHVFCSNCISATSTQPTQWQEPNSCPVCSHNFTSSPLMIVTPEQLQEQISTHQKYPPYVLNHAKLAGLQEILDKNKSHLPEKTYFIICSQFRSALYHIQAWLSRQMQFCHLPPAWHSEGFSLFFTDCQKHLVDFQDSVFNEGILLLNTQDLIWYIKNSGQNQSTQLWDDVKINHTEHVEVIFLDYDYTNSDDFYVLMMALLPLQNPAIAKHVSWLRLSNSFEEDIGRLFDQKMRDHCHPTEISLSLPQQQQENKYPLFLSDFNHGCSTLPSPPLDLFKSQSSSSSSSFMETLDPSRFMGQPAAHNMLIINRSPPLHGMSSDPYNLQHAFSPLENDMFQILNHLGLIAIASFKKRMEKATLHPPSYSPSEKKNKKRKLV